MTDAMTAAEVGVAKLSAATAAPVTDDEKEKVASRFVWQPGDVTIINPDGTIVAQAVTKK
jgi:hypothetical protein